MATSIEDQRIESRVSRIESEVESLAQSVSALTASVGRMQDGFRDDMNRISSALNAAIADLTEKLSARSRTNWGTIAGVATVALGVAGLVGNLALQPIRDRQILLEDRVDKSQALSADNAKAIAASEIKFAEVETQFHSGDELDELRYQMVKSEADHIREVLRLRHELDAERGEKKAVP